MPLLAMLALAGCFSDRGMAIEIDVGKTGATHVELFIGQTQCDADHSEGIDCTGIGTPYPSADPPTVSKLLAGNIWFRDAEPRYTAPVKDGVATFQLQAAPNTTLPIVIAVGSTDADGVNAVGTVTLQNLTPPTSTARVVTAKLTSALPTDDTEAMSLPDGDYVQVWTKQSPASSCLMVEHWQGGTATRDFIVPADDPDCDGVDPECNPQAWFGTENEPSGSIPIPPPPTINCLAGDNGNPCQLGFLACDDKSMDQRTCQSAMPATCVPSLLCPVCRPDNEDCLRNQFQTHDSGNSDLPRIDCDVPATAPLTVCQLQSSATLDLSSYVDGNCSPVTIGGLPLQQQLGTSQTFDGAMMKVTDTTGRCGFTMTWQSGTLTGVTVGTNESTDVGVIGLTKDGATLLMPIILHFHRNECLGQFSQFSCAVKGSMSDTLWQCGK